MESETRILLISGSLRRQSTNTALLQTVKAIAPDHVTATLYEGTADLPHFNPEADADPRPAPVADLRAAIRRSDALLVSVPEYAGALPGSFKNVLDWAVGDDQPGSLHQKPVAWVNVSPRGAVNAHESLRRVFGYVGAVVAESACIAIPLTPADVEGSGLISSVRIRAQLTRAFDELLRAIRSRAGTA